MPVILRVLALLASLQAAPAPPVHPLDALTGDEIALAVRLARGDARLASAAFPTVALLEPAKADVLAWQPGRPLPRQARIQAMTPAQVYEVVVDLTARRAGIGDGAPRRRAVDHLLRSRSGRARAHAIGGSSTGCGRAAITDLDEAVLRAVRRRLLRDPGARRQAADPRRLLRHAAIDHQRLRLADRAAVRARRSAAARGDRGHRRRRRADRAGRSELQRGGRRRVAARRASRRGRCSRRARTSGWTATR